jgi:hypothetical protein
MRVTVALVGDPAHASSLTVDELTSGEDTPYSELPTVTLDAGATDTLAEVLERASTEFNLSDDAGYPYSPTWISFYRPEHDDGYSLRGESPVLTLVDEKGRAVWGVSFTDPRVTIDALVRASQAGVVEGDVRRPYLVIRPGYGNGLLPDWSELIVGLTVGLEILRVAADASDAVTGARWLRDRAKGMLDRFRRLPDLFRKHGPKWGDHNGWPYDVYSLIHSRSWRAVDLAGLLGVSTDEAETLLSGLGLVRDPRTDLWSMGTDPESQTLDETFRFVLHHEWTGVVDGNEETLRVEIERQWTKRTRREIPDEDET